jgi:alpha-tubulin suppressor-like RCC1 family protein
MGVRSVSVGDQHACAVLEDQTAVCWGLNAFGALGDGTTDLPTRPVAVKDLGGIAEIAAGESSTSAIDGAGAVSCWGSNVFGELGDGQRSAGPNAMPMLVTALSTPASMIASALHGVCAVLTSGTVECWGENVFGLGPDANSVGIPPTPLPGLTNVRAVALGEFFGCALLADQTVSCWGAGALGQTEATVFSVSRQPVAVPGLAGVVEISAGQFHACARLGDGTVWCWGSSESFGLTLDPRGAPTMMGALSGALSLSSGGLSACAVLTSGAVRCLGPLGTGQGPVGGVSNAVSVSVGSSSACAVISDGTIECWGEASTGGPGDVEMTQMSATGVKVAAPSTDATRP